MFEKRTIDIRKTVLRHFGTEHKIKQIIELPWNESIDK
jgi:hypothetical protein